MADGTLNIFEIFMDDFLAGRNDHILLLFNYDELESVCNCNSIYTQIDQDNDDV